MASKKKTHTSKLPTDLQESRTASSSDGTLTLTFDYDPDQPAWNAEVEGNKYSVVPNRYETELVVMRNGKRATNHTFTVLHTAMEVAADVAQVDVLNHLAWSADEGGRLDHLTRDWGKYGFENMNFGPHSADWVRPGSPPTTIEIWENKVYRPGVSRYHQFGKFEVRVNRMPWKDQFYDTPEEAVASLKEVLEGTWTMPKKNNPNRTKNAEEGDADYHLRNVILPEDDEGRSLAEKVLDWHGGQSTMLYSLGSTGMSDYVSPSMIDAGVDELERIVEKNKTAAKEGRHKLPAKDIKELKKLIGDLDAVARFSSEFVADEGDSGYATWLMGDVEEGDVQDNPRKPPSTFMVEIVEDKTGAVTVTPVSEKIKKKYAKHMKEMTGHADPSAFIQEGLESAAQTLELTRTQVRDISSGWPVTVRVSPWNFGHLLGYDAHELDVLSSKPRKPRQENAYKGDALADAKRRKYGYPEPPKKDKRRKNPDAEMRKLKNRVLK